MTAALGWLKQALHDLYEQDRQLFELGVGETALCFRLGHHLANRVDGPWDVDAEYDREGTAAHLKTRNPAYGTHMRPDLVIHRRGRGGRTNNLLFLEVKRLRGDSLDDGDVDKAAVAVVRHHYQLGVALALSREDGFAPSWWVWVPDPRGVAVPLHEGSAVFGPSELFGIISGGHPAAGLADAVLGVIGSATVSLILHGSFATGDFRSGRSDVDLLTVVDRPLTDAEAAALEGLVRDAEIGTATGVDLHVVTTEAVAAPSPAPPVELHVGRYDRTSRGRTSSGRTSTRVEVARRVAGEPDLPAELSAARANGRTLHGLSPGEVIAPVPGGWVVARGRHWLTTWLSLTDDAEHGAFMVLTACRIWRFAAEGVHCSKAEAAAWALEQDPSLTAVRQAREQYAGRRASMEAAGIADVLRTVLDHT
ncbi:aminoglycoside adenylyltransferase domain-containing protein [Actinoplanes sp. DH11]|uniref:aminoglycoside adenylyltransferase domain-containing protein n=1 Tax=Actinoplanes sp. DH11 TaxID=2857011 RepID=UPI001E4EBB7E|nr:aminoglycoside adenylyltransferase domain-containing protein [Actinoplanes sp. DH11]